jgi:hypothetical protein
VEFEVLTPVLIPCEANGRFEGSCLFYAGSFLDTSFDSEDDGDVLPRNVC